ncbi:hypothetical protein TVAG_416990 [Trichomonas vaginalis G3]|uniref:VPS9 domain-containing protein n=1 Tax=Trichomonas vaginalis (strain ATCC PRA-98 / G3) TaxID=412133 RepID=A2ESF7_TRIV3|nr:hypothetical protein TVAGG3_0277970 [Trichomonas vaginalis G3]EAY04401.1 hypothetical protein TVAG_416990 [Trichomonas vaginalis G3]KAI5526342.1 hypothetical protein TVAGG3_0277970 [Trichomonas vaginalis G3]|eukprot:XP_001316624.1 hypothetical protein [Trichomonas vaginalis G3]
MRASVDYCLKLKQIQTKIHQNIQFASAFFQNGEDQLVKINTQYNEFKDDFAKYFSRLKDIIIKLAETGVAFTQVKDTQKFYEFLESKNVIPEHDTNVNIYEVYLEQFPKYFDYFLFKHDKVIELTQGGRTIQETHESFMRELYNKDTEKINFFNLAKVEFLTPQFIRFLNKNLDISHIFFNSTFNRDNAIAKQEFLDNFMKNLDKCPEYILDLIKIDKNVITMSLKPLINQHPQLLNLVPYYVDLKNKNNQFDIQIPDEIIEKINSIVTQKTAFIPEEIKSTLEKLAGTDSRETEAQPAHQKLRELLKILPPLPVIHNQNQKYSIKEYLTFAINMIHSNKREYYLKKLNEICKDRNYQDFIDKTRNPQYIFNEIKRIDPKDKLQNAEQSIRYKSHYQFLIKYEENLSEIQNQIIGYTFVIFESDKSKPINLIQLTKLYTTIYTEYKIHKDFINKNYKEDLKKIKLDYFNMDCMLEKFFTNERAKNLEYFVNGEEKALDFQADLFRKEKWMEKKHKFVKDLSYDKDPLELYKIFNKYQDKIMKKFESNLTDLGSDQATPFFYAYVYHCMPSNLLSTLKYIALYKKIYPATQNFFEIILSTMNLRIFDE